MVGQTRSATGPRTTKIVLSRCHRFFLSAPLHILAFGFKAGFPAVLSAADADDRMPPRRGGEVDWIKNRFADLSASLSDCLLAAGIPRPSASAAETNESKECADYCRYPESYSSRRDRARCEGPNNLPCPAVLLCLGADYSGTSRARRTR